MQNVILMALGIVLSGIILRIACGTLGEKQPPLGRAILIAFIAGAICFVANYLVGLIMGEDAGSKGHGISAVVSGLSSAEVYRRMIPTTFGKGIVIWVVQLVIIVTAAVLLGIAMGALMRAT